MQPTFLPWSGYFALMLQSEAFVFLDHVQFTKRSWQQRNQIKTSQGPQWITVPVFTKGAREQKISEVEIDQASGWAEKALRTIQQNYAKAPHFKSYSEPFFAILRKKEPSLAQLNRELIEWFMAAFSIQIPLYSSSHLAVDGTKAELLASVCECFGAQEYVSAIGSKEYIEESTAFSSKGIAVTYNRYQPTPYHQLHGDFVPYLSALDLVFNEGPNCRNALAEGLKIL